VISGQGTVALEMLAREPALEVLVVPVGGGGLIAGMAVAAKAAKPGIELYGVETENFPSMYCALRGETARCAANTIAEGIAVREPGALTLPIVRELTRGVLLVGEGEIEHAIVLLLEIEKTVAEGAGAAGLAALLAHPERFRGRRVGIVLSGGNIDPLMLSVIIERGMVRAGRLARLTIELRDLPERSPRSPPASPRPTPTSRKCTISAPSPTCRCRPPKSISCCRPAAASTSRRSSARCARQASPRGCTGHDCAARQPCFLHG